MSGTFEKLQTINSIIRTLLALVVVGGAGIAGWYGYETYTSADQELEDAKKTLEEKDQELAASRQQLDSTQKEVRQQKEQLAQKDIEITDLNEDIEQKEIEIQQLATALRLHKMKRRLARITVKDVGWDPNTRQKFSRIEFVELNDLGDPIDKPKEYQLEGDLVYVDCLVVKFEDKYVEASDLERGTSICMFSRIFGEYQQPQEGFYLDEPGKRPGAYARGGVLSDLEKKIWDDFWNIANDPKKATELGIRTLHGDAVSIKVNKGKIYQITVRASGGPEIEVVEDEPARNPSGLYS
jgi:hypothetical protein